MNKFGPSRQELKFRMWASVVGLSMLVGAVLYRGMPTGPAMFEVIGIAGAFFGGTLIWTILKLRKQSNDQES